MLLILSIACFALIGYLLFLLRDLKNYCDQLTGITTKDTNQELQTHSRLPYLRKMVLLNNRLIRNHKLSRQQLLSETRQLEQAIHNISHDLRTPLTVASGYVQLLEQDTSATIQQKEILEKISTNLDNVEKHLEQLLEYQRLKENQIQPVLAEVNVSRLLQEELLNLYTSFEESGIELEVEIENDLYLITDAKLLARIFQNILGNMLKHGVKIGQLSLKKNDDIIILRASNQLKEQIAHPERLTERFYTEDLSRQSQNSGLGLFIVKELSEKLGSEMQLQVTTEDFEITLIF